MDILTIFCSSLSKIYAYHHKRTKKSEFSLLEKERGKLFSQLIGTGKKVLDIGCRDGTLTQYFAKNNNVLGVDIDKNMLKNCERKLGIRTKLVDLNTDWPFKEKFDVVVAAEIIEHLYYPEIICKRIRSVLKPNGLFIGSVPNAYNIKNRLRYLFGIQKNTPLEDRTHINQFSYKWLHEVLKQEFSEVEIIGLAAGATNVIAKAFPNLGSFMLVWRCVK